jgi:hypothetical protein
MAKEKQKHEQEQEQEHDPFFDIYSGRVPAHKLAQYFTPSHPEIASSSSSSSSHTTPPTVKHDDRIFVSIASYRDPQLLATISSLIAMCSDPRKLTIVICEQSSSQDPVFSLQDFSSEGASTVLISMDSSLARGPTWARHLIQQQWTGEEFYLQIDSHTRFVEGWDQKLKAGLSALPAAIAAKACLSNYPPDFDVLTGEPVDAVLRGPMYVTHIDPSDRFVRFNSDYIDSDSDGDSDSVKEKVVTPVLSKGWSACFSFSSSQIILDAPYDPYVPFLFFGEEMDIFARLYTRGWAMFAPSVPICFTVFDRSYRQTYWGHPDNELVRFSRMRLHHKFGLLSLSVQSELQQGKDRYYLGREKTMTDFFQYVGLDEDLYYNYNKDNIPSTLLHD